MELKDITYNYLFQYHLIVLSEPSGIESHITMIHIYQNLSIVLSEPSGIESSSIAIANN